MTTIREQLQVACETTGDDPDTIVCFYQEMRGMHNDINGNWISIFDETRSPRPVKRGPISDVPSFDFHAGYGGEEGPPFLGFSDRYVYVHVMCDGSEWIEAVPRHPKYVGKYELPWIGGG